MTVCLDYLLELAVLVLSVDTVSDPRNKDRQRGTVIWIDWG